MRVNNASFIKRIKNIIHRFVNSLPNTQKVKFSVHLSKKLKQNYSYTAQRFSKTEGKTIEKYLRFMKIQRVKKLIQNDRLTFTEIAKKLQFSSLPHLCTQFKKVTGKNLSKFRKEVRSRKD